MNPVVLLMTLLTAPLAVPDLPYPIVDTGQVRFFNTTHTIPAPGPGEPFAGQDAATTGNLPRYTDHGDGTVTDEITGLMWERVPATGVTQAQAAAGAATCRTGGYDDWRLPTIKELYSLIQFSGEDINPMARNTDDATPFLDADVFAFRYGDPAKGERVIDAQYATRTLYRGTTMGGNATMFGVNFADGRIKGYPYQPFGPRGAKTFHLLYVRGNPDYGVNDFVDNGDGTVTDRATGLTWQQADSGNGMTWQQALAYAEALTLAGHSDWRLPNAKELQSILEYTRSPDATASAAIDPVFSVTPLTNEAGQRDYPAYWSSTTHIRQGGHGHTAVILHFGRAMGYMWHRWMDVHGAGAQRSDPKAGNPAHYPTGRGPQGDAIRIWNFVRCVRGGISP